MRGAISGPPSKSSNPKHAALGGAGASTKFQPPPAKRCGFGFSGLSVPVRGAYIFQNKNHAKPFLKAA